MRLFSIPSLRPLILSILLASSHLSAASSAFSLPRLLERQSVNSQPHALNIPPSQYWEGIDGPWSTFPLQVGTGNVGGLQNVRVLPSTAGTAIWTIAAEGCPANYVDDCIQSRGGLFLTNQSLTWSPSSIYQTGLEINLGGDSSGYVGYDVATLGWQGSGSEVAYEHSLIWNLADSRYWLGIFGLNPRPTNFTTFTDPQTSFMQALFDAKKIPSVSWGYTAGARYRLNSIYGSLTLGGYDTNRFVRNDVSFDFYPDISRDLSVYLHTIAFKSSESSTPGQLLTDGSISIFIDSTVPDIWLPESACAAFEQAFGLEYDTTWNKYLITSAQRDKSLQQNASVTFMIGPFQEPTGEGDSVEIVLPYAAFDLQLSFPIIMNPNTSYYFPLQRAANDTQYTLGRTFLQEAYLIADYERQNFSVSACKWDQEDIDSQKLVDTISPHAEALGIDGQSREAEANESRTKATKIGIAVGASLLVVILTFLAWVLYRRHRRRKEAELEAKNAEAALTSTKPRPQISAPFGGELVGNDHHVYEMRHSQHALEVPWKAGAVGYTAEMDTSDHSDPGRFGYKEMNARMSAQEVYGEARGGSVYEMPGNEVVEMPTQRTSRGMRGSREWV